MRPNPYLYEINALIFLRRLSIKYHRPLTLSTIPEAEWQRLAALGFDIVWLMGVWQRSPAARREALSILDLKHAYAQALPDWREEDVLGSPYAIHSYRLEPALGEGGELAELKARLNRLGLSLMLDFVPNHLARDHPWTLSSPHWFIQGNEDSVQRRPCCFYAMPGGIQLAHGRDPYFSPWTDTAQLNFDAAEMREALTEELLKMVSAADGVRCDMAMLVLNSVFRQTWGWALGDAPAPQVEFWQDAIRRAKGMRSDFRFLGEAYWGLEGELQRLGFDYTYDKPLYDRLLASPPHEVLERLTAETPPQERMARFIENHDEPRAVVAFGRRRSRAAAIVMATVPGLRLFHDGQLEGRRIRLPVQLGREPEEAPDPQIVHFYQQLLAVCRQDCFHGGGWNPVRITAAWEGNNSHRSLLAWAWTDGQQARTVVVNHSPATAQGKVALPISPAGGPQLTLLDELNGARYTRDARDVREAGLYVDLAPWDAHIFVEA